MTILDTYYNLESFRNKFLFLLGEQKSNVYQFEELNIAQLKKCGYTFLY